MKERSRNSTCLWCRSTRQPPVSHLCKMVLVSGIVPAQQCPTITVEPSYHQHILSSLGNQFQLSPTKTSSQHFESLATIDFDIFSSSTTYALLLTWYFTSKLSYVNLRIIEVFPTDWSPKKTILYFICIVVPASLWTPLSVAILF